MKNRKIILKSILIMIMIFSNISLVYGEDEQSETVGTAEFVDENGNITEIEVQDGTTGEDETEEYSPMARTVSTANMVNFNCSKAGITTSYTDYNTGQAGYLSKANGADAAFLGYENGKVKFMMSGVVGLVSTSSVEVLNKGTYYASNYEVNSSGSLYHYIATNVNAKGNSNGQRPNYNYVGQAPSYLSRGVEYYSYDGHYFYTNYNTMISDYRNNVRSHSVNPSNPYYNYYQYLPLRSKTNYTGTQLNTYLNRKGSGSKLYNTGNIFIKYQNIYGVNALMAASLAIHESGWGVSSIAVNKNNLFGLNAVDSNPSGNASVFSSVDACIKDFCANWMSKWYLNANYTRHFRGGYFGDLGSGIFVDYSSDPYEGEKVAIYASSMDSSIGSKDKNYYTLGIKDAGLTTHTSLNVRKESSTSSKAYYSTIKNAAYAFIVRKKSKENNFYQVQSDSALTSDRNGISTAAEYDFDKSYAYVSSNYITLINNGTDVKNTEPNTSNVVNQPTGKSSSEPTLYYQANCQDTGWLEQVNEPNSAGTTGRSLDLYQLKFNLKNVSSNASIQAKIYTNEGWKNYTSASTIGKEGQAIQLINLQAVGIPGYKIQYRVHSADIGWQNWVDTNQNAGVQGKNIQAIDFRLVKDGQPASIKLNTTSKPIFKNGSFSLKATVDASNEASKKVTWSSSNKKVATVTSSGKVKGVGIGMATITAKTSNGLKATCRVSVNSGSVYYRSHIQNIGWQKTKSNGSVAGTTGKSLRMEALKISLKNTTGSIRYKAHVANVGWQGWRKNSAIAGTVGQSRQMEAVQIKLTGDSEKLYDVYYRVYSAKYGWLGWAKNGQSAGTQGYGYRMEAIQVKLVKKGNAAPGKTTNCFKVR